MASRTVPLSAVREWALRQKARLQQGQANYSVMQDLACWINMPCIQRALCTCNCSQRRQEEASAWHTRASCRGKGSGTLRTCGQWDLACRWGSRLPCKIADEGTVHQQTKCCCAHIHGVVLHHQLQSLDATLTSSHVHGMFRGGIAYREQHQTLPAAQAAPACSG